MRIDDKRVLIVDDIEVNRVVLEERLSAMGALVMEVDNAKEALEQLVTKQFDIAFVDLQLGGASGESVVRASKKAGVTSPIIAWTAELDNKKYLKRGFTGVLNKPLENKNLFEVLKTAFPQLEVEPKNLTVCTYATSGDLDNLPEKLIELINLRKEDLPTELYRIRRAVDLGNWDKAARLTHSLIGFTGTLGFINFSNKLREVEECLRAKKLGNCMRVLETITEAAMDIAVDPLA